MREPVKVTLAIIIAMALLISTISAIYVSMYYGEEENDPQDPTDENPITDTTPPTILDVDYPNELIAGSTATFILSFSDNEEVTTASFYYRYSPETTWTKTSILNSVCTLIIDEETTSTSLEFYFEIDDEAGNGPVLYPNNSTYLTLPITPQDNTTDEPYVNHIFIEESSATDCKYCPNVAEIIHSLYESELYDFHYVSLVEDESSVAANRLTSFNNFGNPTVYIDGGYQVITGGLNPESDYIQAIVKASQRSKPNLTLTLKNTIDDSKQLTSKVTISNHQEHSYNGTLKLYLTEIISPWNDYQGNPYHYALVDYVGIETLTIEANKTLNASYSLDLSSYDIDNLKVIAVLFNATGHEAFAYPPEDNPFTAYYTDACTASSIVEGGNLPPAVGITFPTQGKWYNNNNLFLSFLYKNRLLAKTRVFGDLTVTVNASDDNGLANVSLYLDGNLLYTANTSFTTTIETAGIFTSIFGLRHSEHTLKVIATDIQGKQSDDSLTIHTSIL